MCFYQYLRDLNGVVGVNYALFNLGFLFIIVWNLTLFYVTLKKNTKLIIWSHLTILPFPLNTCFTIKIIKWFKAVALSLPTHRESVPGFNSHAGNLFILSTIQVYLYTMILRLQLDIVASLRLGIIKIHK